MGMALDKSKSGFGFDLEEKFKKVITDTDAYTDTHKDADTHAPTHKPADTDADKDAHKDKHTHTHTDKDKHTPTDAYTDTDADIVLKENKSKKTYGLVRPSVYEKVTNYAKARNRSYNDIVCELLDQFIKEKGL